MTQRRHEGPRAVRMQVLREAAPDPGDPGGGGGLWRPRDCGAVREGSDGAHVEYSYPKSTVREWQAGKVARTTTGGILWDRVTAWKRVENSSSHSLPFCIFSG